MDRSKNSIQMGYQCKNPFVCCLFIFFYIFVSRSFPLPSAFLSTDIERGKVFGLNTLRRRKIQSETACRLTFQLSRADVLPSQTSKGKGRMTESENSYISQIDDRPNQILSCNNEKCTVLLLVHKKLYLCSKMSCTSMQITQVCRNQNSCQLITSFLNFPHKLFILSGL